MGSIENHGMQSDAPDVSGGTIRVMVGKQKTEFHVPAGLLRNTSKHFQVVLGEGWKNCEYRRTELRHHEPNTFEVYVRWLYTRKIWTGNGTSEEEINAELLVQAKAYILGTDLQDTPFQDTVLDTFARMTRDAEHWPEDDVIQLIWARTRLNSPFRRLLLHQWVWYGDEDWIDENTPKRFVRDFAEEILVMRDELSETMPFEKNACLYHVHGDHVQCYKTS
ncbi:MAG: hypothetical protein M1820_010890 [Bogoriella megaspora]|nr:MAG: hypothetical protein M1820_010890 [Bogoriella megaspora]